MYFKDLANVEHQKQLCIDIQCVLILRPLYIAFPSSSYCKKPTQYINRSIMMGDKQSCFFSFRKLFPTMSELSVFL